MSGISALGTTYNLPNFTGELFGVSPEDTPLLSAIGGLTGGESVASTIFQWQTYDLRDADATRQRVEGADAPTTEGRVRSSVSNVVEIHQEQVSVSYSKLAATRQVSSVSQLGNQPVQNELAWQLQQELKQIARDVEKSFIVSTYAAGDGSTARKTRGLKSAITTNKKYAGSLGTDSAEGGTASAADTTGALTAALVLDTMQLAWENGGIQESETRTIICGPTVKRNLSKLFITDKNYREMTRNVGGVNLQTIETDFGLCNIMLNRYMPTGELIVADLGDLRPAFLEIPGKGHFFAEPLAKAGSAEKWQLYGEIGLQYGNEKHHARLANLTNAVL